LARLEASLSQCRIKDRLIDLKLIRNQHRR
jgi:hypothetical protein